MFSEVGLSKDSWHYKVQVFVLGKVPYRDNFCPYFWLSTFCLLVFPVYSFFLVLIKVFSSITGFFGFAAEKTFSAIDSVLCRPLYKWSAENASDEQIVYMWKRSKDRAEQLWEAKYDREYEILISGWEEDIEEAEKQLLEAAPEAKPFFEEALADLKKSKPERQQQNGPHWYWILIPGQISLTAQTAQINYIEKNNKKFEMWKKKQGPVWREILEEAIRKDDEKRRLKSELEHEKWLKQRAFRESLEERRTEIKVRMEKKKLSLLKVSKIAVPTSFLFLTGAIFYGAAVATTWLYNWGDWSQWSHQVASFVKSLVTSDTFQMGIVIAVVSVTSGIFIFFLVKRIASKCDLSIPDSIIRIFRKSAGAFSTMTPAYLFVTNLSLRMWVGFTGFIGFFFDFFKMWKNNNCPSINWKD